MKTTEIKGGDPSNRTRLLQPGEKPWLNAGCGYVHIKGAVNADSNPACMPDLVFDLTQEWPIETESIGWICMMNVFEHLPDGLHVMGEAWRCLKPQGTMDVVVPYWLNGAAIEDPTHVKQFSPASSIYWQAETYRRHTSWYTSARMNFDLVGTELSLENDVLAGLMAAVELEAEAGSAVAMMLVAMQQRAVLPGYFHYVAFHLRKAELPVEEEPTILLINYDGAK